MRHFERFCDNIENVENYEAAKKDNFKGWQCHHRLETHTSDGEKRPVDITKEELNALGMYWHRPAEELIFMTRKDHVSLHMKENGYAKGHSVSEEGKRSLSKANKGKHLSKETRKKIGEARKGMKMSEETKNILSDAFKGKHWKLVEGKRVWY